MNTELHKRIEEAADKYARRVVPTYLSEYKECIKEAKEDFCNGAKYGYKEAIALAKEWLEQRYDIFDILSKKEILSDFEANMNKL